MAEFFKTLLKGVIYVVLLPFILLALALAFVYNVIMFIYMTIKNLVIFFSGGDPYGDLPEDKQAKKILAQRLMQPTPSLVPNAGPELVRPSSVTQPVEQPLSEQEDLANNQSEGEGGDDDGNFTQTY